MKNIIKCVVVVIICTIGAFINNGCINVDWKYTFGYFIGATVVFSLYLIDDVLK
jgi:hypothetical protein